MPVFEPHKAYGRLMACPIGNDGVRWACETCNETVFERFSDDMRTTVWLHFRKELNLPEENR